MTREGLCYHDQQGNCLVGIDDDPRAQALLDQQLKTDWAKLCDGLAEPLNPIPETLFEPYPATDYWTCHQSEWATDIVFRDAAFLQRLMAILVPHGMLSFSSSDVLRYFWKRVNRTGAPPASFNGDLQINLPEYRDGKRVNGLREYRPEEGGPKQDLQWRPWRKGIAGLHRRAEISQKVNARVIQTLASVDDSRRVEELTAAIQPPVIGKRRVRALRPWGDDQDLLAAINHGELSDPRMPPSRSATAAVLYPSDLGYRVPPPVRHHRQKTRIVEGSRAHPKNPTHPPLSGQAKKARPSSSPS